MVLEDAATVLAVVGSIIAVISVIIATRSARVVSNSGKKGYEKESETKNAYAIDVRDVSIPPVESRSVENKEVKEAEDVLRTLNVEREIVSYALTRLYEAEVEGKISEDERVLLVNKYKSQLHRLEEQIKNKELIVNLFKLEETKEDLVKMFKDKFDEITKNIENIQRNLKITPKAKKEIIEEPPLTKLINSEKDTIPEDETAPQNADQQIETIQKEIFEVLDRLERFENKEPEESESNDSEKEEG